MNFGTVSNILLIVFSFFMVLYTLLYLISKTFKSMITETIENFKENNVFPKSTPQPNLDYRDFYSNVAPIEYKAQKDRFHTDRKGFGESIGNLLAIYGVSYEELDVSDIIRLNKINYWYFDFLLPREIKKLIILFSARDAGQLFIKTGEAFEVWYRDDTNDTEDRFTRDVYVKIKWRKNTRKKRRKIFKVFLKLIDEHPNTPIELLSKLI